MAAEGIITADTVWTAGSTVELTGDVQVAAGATLRIEAGTVVHGNGHALQAVGALVVAGAADHEVLLDDVEVAVGGNGADHPSISLDYTIQVGGALLPPASGGAHANLRVTNSRFESLRGYSYLVFPAGDVLVAHNVFHDVGGFAVGADFGTETASITLRDNTFSGWLGYPYQDGGYALIVDWASYGGTPLVTGNNFLDAGKTVLALQAGYQGTALSASGNWFGTTDPAVLAGMVWDGTDGAQSASILRNTHPLAGPSPTAWAVAGAGQPGTTVDVTAGNTVYYGASPSTARFAGTRLADFGYAVQADGSVQAASAVGTTVLVGFGRVDLADATITIGAGGTYQVARKNIAARNDVDGDGRGDLVWQNASGTPSVWAMQGGAGGAAVGAYLNYGNPGSSWRLVGTADLNGDGRADLLWQDSSGLPSAWLVGQGGGSVAGYPTFSNPGASWRLVGGADVNGDGRADFVWQNADGMPSAWLMGPDGTQVAGYPTFSNPGPDWRLVGAGDLNGDGRADLVWQNANGAASAWLMGGSLDAPEVSAYANFSNPGADWRLVGTADLNGDGRDDLLWQNQNGLPSAWLMGPDGMSVAGYPTFSNPGADWRLVGAADANGDGRADLVWQNSSGLPSLWITGAGGASVEGYPVLNNPGADWKLA